MHNWNIAQDYPSMPSVLAPHPPPPQLSSPTLWSGWRPQTQLLRGDKGAAVRSLQDYHDDKACCLLLLQMKPCGKVKPTQPHRQQWIINHKCHSNQLKWNFFKSSKIQLDPLEELCGTALQHSDRLKWIPATDAKEYSAS